MKIKPLDYILDNNDNFWIVKCIYNNNIYGEMVYKKMKKGRYNNITHKYYQKVIINNKQRNHLIKHSNIKKIFYAQKFYRENKSTIPTKWKKIFELLEKIGIKEKNIGIFGSYLIGFDLEKDIDIVVYNDKSYFLISDNIDKIRKELNVTPITDDHIKYQMAKYQHLYHKDNDLYTILKHNWVGLQFGHGVLSTIRFIKNNTHYINMRGKNMQIIGEVIEDKDTNYIPRVGVIKTLMGNIKVITYFWMFNSFLKKQEKVLINGVYNKQKKELYLYNDKHWIKYLKETNH